MKLPKSISSITGLSIIAIFLQFLITGDLLASRSDKQYKILVVHSYGTDYVTYPDLNAMIAADFRKERLKTEIRTEYLDCERRSEREEIAWMYEMIEHLGSWKPDLILVNDDQATYSLLSSAHPILQTIPIVFIGVNYPNWAVLKKYTEVTGFWDKPDYEGNVRMIEQLLGKTRIRFLYDDTYLGRQAMREIADQFNEKYPETSQKIYKRLASPIGDTTVLLPSITQRRSTSHLSRPDSTLFYFVNLRDQYKNGVLWEVSGMVKYSAFVQIKYDYTTMRIGHMAAVPSFSVFNEGFDYNRGVLGGYMTPLDIQIAEGVQCAARILRGEKASNIPIVQSVKKYMLDWGELMRWGIKTDTLPPNYEIIHMPFYVRYLVELIVIGTLLLISIITLICYLIYLYTRESKRKREAQLNLKKEKEFLSLALEGSNIFVWKYDMDNDILSFDKEFFEDQGIPQRTYTIEQMWSMVHPDDYGAAVTESNKINGRQVKAKMNSRCDFNGRGYVWYEYRYMTVSMSNSIIGLILNIQDYKNRERELTEARDLAAKAELKQSFLANMSHEIRTPLNAIVGFSNMLVSDDEQTTDEKREFIDIINRNCELLLKLVGDILEISRIESNNITFIFEKVNITELIDDVYSTFQMMVPENVQFLKEIPQNPVVIRTDKFRLNQVVTNLVNNAVKFTSSGNITVGYKTDEQAHQLLIYVKDTGIGIPENEQKMIFERFYKRDEFAQGTGLGLPICQGIVNKLGGAIILESGEGKGSTFTIVLPYNPQHE